MASPLTLADLANEPTLAHAQLRQYPGRVRGSALGPWAANLNRRHGPDAAAAIRARLGVDVATLPDAPTAETWLAGALQLAATDAIVAAHYGGDLVALEPSLLDDVRRNVGRVSRLVLRGLGPTRLLSNTAKLHDSSWDIGAASASVTPGSATILVQGSPLFTYRTWLALQLMALRAAIELTGREVHTRHVTRLATDRAQIDVRWG